MPNVLPPSESHCPWVGNCIGERNHRFFFFFLFAVTALAALCTVTTFHIVLQEFAKTAALDTNLPCPIWNTTSAKLCPYDFSNVPSYAEHFWQSVLSMPITVLFGIFALGTSWTLISLLCFHAMIISIAQTTNERVRNVYQYGRNPNVDDHGCLQNWHHAFCSPRPESQLPHDFTEVIFCDHSKPEAVWGSHMIPVQQKTKQQGAPMGGSPANYGNTVV